MESSLAALCAAIVAMAAPLLLAALGETISEKAGVVNLSLDGSLLFAAMSAFVVASWSGSLLLGFIAAALAGAFGASLLAVIGVVLGQSQVAVGFALTFLLRDLAYFLGNPFARTPGPQMAVLPVPGLADVPFAGQVLFRHSLIVYVSVLAVPLCLWLLQRTRLGLIVRAAGENPEGCWARGINPVGVQSMAAVAGGMLVGLAGGAYSLAVKPGWGHPQGCEGIGWIALALVIFGSWHPLRVAIGAYFFGFLQILGIVLQQLVPAVPAQIFQVAPFPLMIFTLVLLHFGQNSTGQRHGLRRFFHGDPPRWLGQSYKQS